MTQAHSSDSLIGRVVVLKAFGDLVIAAQSLRQAQTSGWQLAAGIHLMPLAQALGLTSQLLCIDHGETGVPAMFDVKRCGVWRALGSMLGCRAALARSVGRAPLPLVFDRAGLRERWLGTVGPARTLPQGLPNIYLAYAAFLGGAPAQRLERASQGGGVGIFPGSRVAAKNMPLDWVRRCLDWSARAHQPGRLILLQDERPDLEAAFPEAEIVPRRFEALRDAVASCRAMFSADSLPAHLAEYCGVPVYVLSPVPNPFWLPLSSFQTGDHALFSDDAPPSAMRFLTQLA